MGDHCFAKLFICNLGSIEYSTMTALRQSARAPKAASNQSLVPVPWLLAIRRTFRVRHCFDSFGISDWFPGQLLSASHRRKVCPRSFPAASSSARNT